MDVSNFQRFEFEEEGSSKFWEIQIEDCDVTTRWGRIGTSGQSKTKTFHSAAEAQKEHDKLVKEKTSKGYRSAGSTSNSGSSHSHASSTTHPIAKSNDTPLASISNPKPPSEKVTQSVVSAEAASDTQSTTPDSVGSQQVDIQLVQVQKSQFADGSNASKWLEQGIDLGYRRVGYFADPTSKLAVAGFQRPPNTLIAIIERNGTAWCEVVSFYSDKKCDAWSNFPGSQPEHDWLEMDHDSRASLEILVTSSANASARGKRDIVPASQFAAYFGEYLTRKGLSAPPESGSSTPAASTPVGAFDDEVMAYAMEFLPQYKRNASLPVDAVPSGKALLSRNSEELGQILIAAFRLTRRATNRTGYDILFPLRQRLLKKKLPLKEADVDFVCEELQKEVAERGGIDSTILAAIEAAAKSHPLSPKARELLRGCRDKARDSWQVEKQAPFKARIDVMLGETGVRIPLIHEGSAWTKVFIATLDAMPQEKRKAWIELLHHCVQATTSKASASWKKIAAKLVAQVGHADLHAMISSWPPLLVSVPDRVNEEAFLGGNQDILRGLIWCCAIEPNARTPVTLREIGIASFKALVALGPRTRVGNACVQVLGEIGNTEAVAQLAVLKAKVKNGSAQRGIAKQLEETARRLGVSDAELEEISVPTFGLDDVGLRVDTLGNFTARLVVTTHGAELNWFRSDGSPQKSVPTEVKNKCPEELKELKDAVKDIDSILSAQRIRIESLYCIPHGWSLATWKDRYLDHPLVGVLARKLIWQFVDGQTETSGIWHQGQLMSSAGEPLQLADTATVKLWHPLNEPAERVLAWRTWLVNNSVEQPFKQAHREIYLLTDAERRTATYSNRFAAHFLRQSQFRSLAQTRRWKVNFMGGFDGGDVGIARKEFQHHNIAVDFWLNAAGEIDPAGYGYAYGSSDQVRFYQPLTNHQPCSVETVPPIIFSEAMRDVDLFVGVCSIGNDPTWMDAGNRNEAFNEYWRSQADANLTESGKMRHAVLEQILPMLKISAQCELRDRALIVQGKLCKYRIHLGSGNIMMEPNNQYLCIVQDRASKAERMIQLPFAGDTLLSIILSKAFLLAEDDKIKDPTILRQIKM
jgi:predicted DNA-binding WGR domain protein